MEHPYDSLCGCNACEIEGHAQDNIRDSGSCIQCGEPTSNHLYCDECVDEGRSQEQIAEDAELDEMLGESPENERSERQGDLIALFRAQY